MKTLKLILALTLAVALALPIGAYASTAAYTGQAVWYVTDTGDATGPAGAFLAFGGAPPMSGAQAIIDFASVTADNAADRFYVLTETGDATTVDVAAAAAQNTLPVAATSALTLTAGAGSWVAIWDPSTGKFEVNRISSGTAATNIVLVRNLANAYTTSTRVRELEASYSLPVGNGTLTTPAALPGKRGQVLGFYVDGTSACRLNAVSGSYK